MSIQFSQISGKKVKINLINLNQLVFQGLKRSQQKIPSESTMRGFFVVSPAGVETATLCPESFRRCLKL